MESLERARTPLAASRAEERTDWGEVEEGSEEEERIGRRIRRRKEGPRGCDRPWTPVNVTLSQPVTFNNKSQTFYRAYISLLFRAVDLQRARGFLCVYFCSFSFRLNGRALGRAKLGLAAPLCLLSHTHSQLRAFSRHINFPCC